MKILIPLDGSKFAENVLEPVTHLLDLKDRTNTVHLMKVVDQGESHPTWVLAPPVSHVMASEYELLQGARPAWAEGTLHTGILAETRFQAEDRARHLAEAYLDRISCRYFFGRAEKVVVAGNDPAEEIQAYARQEKVDLIAMATHGRKGLAKLVLGSVADKLLRSRVAPVYLVRPNSLHEDDPEPVESVPASRV